MTRVYGAQRLVGDLTELGYNATLVTAPNGSLFAVIRDHELEFGRFAGRSVDLGLEATADFPKTVASAIHVRAAPQLYDISDSVPMVRNIQPSVLGPEWRYWSHNFGWSGEKTARRLTSQINQILRDA